LINFICGYLIFKDAFAKLFINRLLLEIKGKTEFNVPISFKNKHKKW